jgi:hypothetical protein
MTGHAEPNDSIEMHFPKDFTVVAAVSDDDTLAQNLKRSPLLTAGAQLRLYRNCRSITEAYQAGLSEAETKYIVFAHQDVYLPKLWVQQVGSTIAYLDKTDPTWAILGVYGVQDSGEHVGSVWASGLGRALHRSPGPPRPVISLDELVFVIRRSAGIRFDLRLPNFHLYGTDIVLAARSLGRTAYAAHMPVIHNSRPAFLGRGYVASYRYMQRKWWGSLPVPTTVVPLTKSGYRLWYKLVHQQALKVAGYSKTEFRQVDPVLQAKALEYE